MHQPSPSFLQRLMLPLVTLAISALASCSGCDDAIGGFQPDVGGFEDVGADDLWNPPEGDACQYGGSGSGAYGGGCATVVHCGQTECVHGACLADDDGDHCRCEIGWGGLLCNTCAEGYLPSGTSCVPCEEACEHGSCVGAGGTTVCACSSGYAGLGCDSCEVGFHAEGNACVADSAAVCTPNPCGAEGHRGQCVPDGGAARCVCDAGYAETAAGLCSPECGLDADLCAAATRSDATLVSANGFGAVGYDPTLNRANALLEHVYRNWDEDVWTRDLLYDTYLGLRVDGGAGQWLGELPALGQEYLDDSGIIHARHQVGEFRVDTYVYAPWELSRPSLVLIGAVTNMGSAAADVSLYTLHNYHVGQVSGDDPTDPDATGEEITFRPSSEAFVETGAGGTLLHAPLSSPSHHGCSPDNPYLALTSGRDLSDNAGSEVGDDRVAGFQKDFALGPGETGWFGTVTALERFGDVASVESDVAAAFGTRGAERVLAGARQGWEAWRTAPPAALSPAELQVYRQSEAILRQGQIWEGTDLSRGQIVASLPPGNWNITWMRDMAYAISALVRSSHFEEARAALAFVLSADSGRYEADYVHVPYQVTITRYFGRGREETDFNADGPNIEYDGFGMFLWVLDEYVSSSGDTTLLDEHWGTISTRIADALVALVDETDLISADSSIWEVHWNGQQKHYTYTSLAAVRGLCGAASLAGGRGEQELADTYRSVAETIRTALATHVIDPEGALASSLEELSAGAGYRDIASVEAFNWMVFDPTGETAVATLEAFERDLRVGSGLGFFRNDDGGWYDSQEWVVADLRTALARQHAAQYAEADRSLDWITAQASSNSGMIAELHHPDTRAYEGEIPMVGFGAGAYMLAITNRQRPEPVAPACGSW